MRNDKYDDCRFTIEPDKPKTPEPRAEDSVLHDLIDLLKGELPFVFGVISMIVLWYTILKPLL